MNKDTEGNAFSDKEEENFDSEDACCESYESRVIRRFFKEAAEKPLLTQEQEISFAQQIERGKKEIIGTLAENIKWENVAPQFQERVEQCATKAKKNARETISALKDFWKEGGQEQEEAILKIPLFLLEGIAEEKSITQAIFSCQTTREIINEMVERNVLLVMHVAKKWQDRFLDFEDLMQEGNRGLMKAVEKFNWRKGCRFSTLAVWWIDQSIRRAIENESRTVKIPVYLQGHNNKECFPAPVSLETSIWNSGEKLVLEDVITDKSNPVEEEVEINIRREAINAVLSQLPSHHELVIKLRFGLGTNLPPLTLQMISQIVGKSKERVRQIQEEAFQKLQRPKTSQLLRELL